MQGLKAFAGVVQLVGNALRGVPPLRGGTIPVADSTERHGGRSLQFVLLLALGSLIATGGCGGGVDTDASSMVLATTTSAEDSGLLDALLPAFEANSGIQVKVVAGGSGQALELGRRGDADLLLVHSLNAEKKFIEQGFGLRRIPLMYNDFVIVGPPEDPAGLRGESSVTKALTKLLKNEASFVSRGDESGTHAKEKSLWKESNIEPEGEWYLSAGSGMGATLLLANERRAYTLTDRGTFLAQRKNVELEIVHEGDQRLLNHYSLVELNPQRLPGLNYRAAGQLVEFLQGSQAKQIIAEFGRDRFGEPLFKLPGEKQQP